MTVQVADTLSVGGETYRLATSPLESYFEANPERRPAFEPPDSSAWRGYVADWVIDDERLYIGRLTGWVVDASADSSLSEVGLSSVFPGVSDAGGERVAAGWFSGELHAELATTSLHAPAEPESRERIFSVEAGRVLADTPR